MLPLAILVAINALFLLKYAPRAGVNPWLAMAAYAGSVAVLVGAARLARTKSPVARPAFYIGLIIALSAGLLAILLSVDPMQVRVTRWSAITSFNDALMHGIYPYLGRTHQGQPPSGLPMLFLIALPFQLAGDVGLLQVAVFVGFSVAVYRALQRPWERVTVMLLLALSPAYLWEVAVRSELFSNAALFLFLTLVCERVRYRVSRPIVVWSGVVAGLLSSTRLVALVPFLMYFPGFLARGRTGSMLVFVAAFALAFAATLVPFAWWDVHLFLQYSPLLPQADKTPLWMSFGALVAAGVMGWRGLEFGRFCAATATVFFCTVAAKLAWDVWSLGWPVAFYGSRSDLSYFMFAVPFALFAVFASAPTSRRGERI